jgi:hypothetical protein
LFTGVCTVQIYVPKLSDTVVMISAQVQVPVLES